MSKRRVVVTGLGLLTPLGLNVEDSWKSILAGKSGVKPITQFDVSDFPVRIGATINNFDPTLYLDFKEVRKNDVFIQYAVAASSQALADSGLVVNDANAERIGVIIGAGIGGLPLIEKNYAAYLQGGARKISPNFIPSAIINMGPGLVSIKFGLKGPNFSVVSACATGTHAIGTAMRTIQYGDADVMVTGGTEMANTPLGLGGFSSARALSRRNDDPERASRPWDRDRDGFILGDGAGILVLEEHEHAIRRGAKIYAELAGFGLTSDAFHITAPDETAVGASRTMKMAINDAGLLPTDIDYINAHGTSTIMGDKVETVAIKSLFGPYAYKLAVSSTKSMTGHLLGAAGAVEAVFSVLAIRDQIAPPTINLDNPDEGFDLDFVPHKARKMKINTVISNSFGFGGTNGSLLFRQLVTSNK